MAKKKRSKAESTLQQGCVKWFRLQYSRYSKALFSVPNGGARHPLEAMTLKNEGVTAGVSDLVLAVPNKDNHGVFIEMKTPTGTVSKEQEEFLRLMKSLGYRVEVVRTFEQFVDVVNNQMKNR